MIFYTINGPGHQLEIHDDKIKLMKKKRIWNFLQKSPPKTWQIQNLSFFEITTPQYILWGKISWKSEDGSQGTFRFNTNPEMVKRIEKYMQKMILKNIQNKNLKKIAA